MVGRDHVTAGDVENKLVVSDLKTEILLGKLKAIASSRNTGAMASNCIDEISKAMAATTL
jgi:hypothetical protein